MDNLEWIELTEGQNTTNFNSVQEIINAINREGKVKIGKGVNVGRIEFINPTTNEVMATIHSRDT